MQDSDEAVWRRLRGGDITAFDVLYERYERPLFGFIRAQTRDTLEAEDLFHDAFLAVLRADDASTPLVSFRAWLFQVARHLCMNRSRSRKREGRAFDEVARDGAALLASPPPGEELLLRRERAESLRSAVERLPLALGEVYRLRASGMSYEEVACVLEIPVGTVKSRMNDLVKRLREEMAR